GDRRHRGRADRRAGRPPGRAAQPRGLFAAPRGARAHCAAADRRQGARAAGGAREVNRGPAAARRLIYTVGRFNIPHQTTKLLRETPMDRRSLLKTGLAGSAAIAAPLVLTSRASAQSKYRSEYRMSTVVGTAFPWGKGGDIWLNLVRERTQGRINIKLYPGVSLINGDQTREFSAIRQGVIDLAVGSTINWSPQIRQLNLFSLPFLTQDHAGIDALTKGPVGEQIL